MHQATQRSVISSSEPIKAKFWILKLSFVLALSFSFELRLIFDAQAQCFELWVTFSGSGFWDLHLKTKPEHKTGAKPRPKMLAICRIDTFMYHLTNLSRRPWQFDSLPTGFWHGFWRSVVGVARWISCLPRILVDWVWFLHSLAKYKNWEEMKHCYGKWLHWSQPR